MALRKNVMDDHSKKWLIGIKEIMIFQMFISACYSAHIGTEENKEPTIKVFKSEDEASQHILRLAALEKYNLDKEEAKNQDSGNESRTNIVSLTVGENSNDGIEVKKSLHPEEERLLHGLKSINNRSFGNIFEGGPESNQFDSPLNNSNVLENEHNYTNLKKRETKPVEQHTMKIDNNDRTVGYQKEQSILEQISEKIKNMFNPSQNDKTKNQTIYHIVDIDNNSMKINSEIVSGNNVPPSPLMEETLDAPKEYMIKRNINQLMYPICGTGRKVNNEDVLTPVSYNGQKMKINPTQSQKGTAEFVSENTLADPTKNDAAQLDSQLCSDITNIRKLVLSNLPSVNSNADSDIKSDTENIFQNSNALIREPRSNYGAKLALEMINNQTPAMSNVMSQNEEVSASDVNMKEIFAEQTRKQQSSINNNYNNIYNLLNFTKPLLQENIDHEQDMNKENILSQKGNFITELDPDMMNIQKSILDNLPSISPNSESNSNVDKEDILQNSDELIRGPRSNYEAKLDISEMLNNPISSVNNVIPQNEANLASNEVMKNMFAVETTEQQPSSNVNNNFNIYDVLNFTKPLMELPKTEENNDDKQNMIKENVLSQKGNQVAQLETNMMNTPKSVLNNLPSVISIYTSNISADTEDVHQNSEELLREPRSNYETKPDNSEMMDSPTTALNNVISQDETTSAEKEDMNKFADEITNQHLSTTNTNFKNNYNLINFTKPLSGSSKPEEKEINSQKGNYIPQSGSEITNIQKSVLDNLPIVIPIDVSNINSDKDIKDIFQDSNELIRGPRSNYVIKLDQEIMDSPTSVMSNAIPQNEAVSSPNHDLKGTFADETMKQQFSTNNINNLPNFTKPLADLSETQEKEINKEIVLSQKEYNSEETVAKNNDEINTEDFIDEKDMSSFTLLNTGNKTSNNELSTPNFSEMSTNNPINLIPHNQDDPTNITVPSQLNLNEITIQKETSKKKRNAPEYYEDIPYPYGILGNLNNNENPLKNELDLTSVYRRLKEMQNIQSNNEINKNFNTLPTQTLLEKQNNYIINSQQMKNTIKKGDTNFLNNEPIPLDQMHQNSKVTPKRKRHIIHEIEVLPTQTEEYITTPEIFLNEEVNHFNTEQLTNSFDNKLKISEELERLKGLYNTIIKRQIITNQEPEEKPFVSDPQTIGTSETSSEESKAQKIERLIEKILNGEQNFTETIDLKDLTNDDKKHKREISGSSDGFTHKTLFENIGNQYQSLVPKKVQDVKPENIQITQRLLLNLLNHSSIGNHLINSNNFMQTNQY